MSHLSHPHRLSYSELERYLYLANDPLHSVLFAEDTVGPSQDFDILFEKDYLTHRNVVLAKNEKVLKEEIGKLNVELGYLPQNHTSKELETVTPKLEKPKEPEEFKEEWNVDKSKGT